MIKELLVIACATMLSVLASGQNAPIETRPRSAGLGLKIGVLPPGPLDAMTDVKGVEVGQTTIIRGENIRTGVEELPIDKITEILREHKVLR